MWTGNWYLNNFQSHVNVLFLLKYYFTASDIVFTTIFMLSKCVFNCGIFCIRSRPEMHWCFELWLEANICMSCQMGSITSYLMFIVPKTLISPKHEWRGSLWYGETSFCRFVYWFLFLVTFLLQFLIYVWVVCYVKFFYCNWLYFLVSLKILFLILVVIYWITINNYWMIGKFLVYCLLLIDCSFDPQSKHFSDSWPLGNEFDVGLGINDWSYGVLALSFVYNIDLVDSVFEY